MSAASFVRFAPSLRARPGAPGDPATLSNDSPWRTTCKELLPRDYLGRGPSTSSVEGWPRRRAESAGRNPFSGSWTHPDGFLGFPAVGCTVRAVRVGLGVDVRGVEVVLVGGVPDSPSFPLAPSPKRDRDGGRFSLSSDEFKFEFCRVSSLVEQFLPTTNQKLSNIFNKRIHC